MGNISSVSAKNENDNKLFLTYDDILELIGTNIDTIKKYNPTCILAIGSGGLIPSKMIKAYIDIPLYVISISAYDKSDSLNNHVKIIQWLHKDLGEERVLIVDDVDDTRTSFSFCLEKLKKENNLNKFCFFVLHNKNKNKKKTIVDLDYKNYKYCKFIEDKWIVYPWENKLV